LELIPMRGRLQDWMTLSDFAEHVEYAPRYVLYMQENAPQGAII